ncbi:porin family protein [uncultured Psychroserpens sp.]|uniref:porin family protein n=1 Tax=uncultured Psychroserpens sp. TaxID=255436 RepID=UPI0026309BCD|nr:porin family protein [uncultured Psychroserpens sp.]
MKVSFYFLFFIIGFLNCNAQSTFQNEIKKDTTTLVDNAYREDQFYASITYNLLANKPDGVSQSGFSSGYHIGFIRDMPLNKRRNIAIGVGIGLSSNSYNQTLLISKENDDFAYSVLDDNETEFSKNKFATYLVEFPIEFRWRTSTAKIYDFWRVYTGIKFGYVVLNSSKFDSSTGDLKFSNIDDFNKLQYGLTLSAGYSNFNLHLYYALNNIFNSDATLAGEQIEISSVRIGLIFYIL